MKIIDSTELVVPNDDTIIWRYMDYPKFASIVFDKAIWFSRMDHLTDEYEGELPHSAMDEIIYRLSELYPSMPEQEKMRKAIREAESVRKFKGYTYLSSWSVNEEESFALWRTYLNRSDQGVAIKSTVGRLRKCFESSNLDATIGLVNYTHNVNRVNQDIIGGTKKPYYDYERELRLIIQNHSKVVEEGGKTRHEPHDIAGMSIPVDIDVLIESVYLSPYSPDWLYSLTRKILNEVHSPINPIIVRKSKIRERA